MFLIWPIWAHISTEKSRLQESQLWNSHQLAGSKIVLNTGCAAQKSEATKLVATSFPKLSGLCSESSALMSVDLIFHEQWHGTSVKFDASHHAVVVLLGLGAILVLPLATMPLLKSYGQRATSVLPSCACYLAHLGPHLYRKEQIARITALEQPPASRV